MHGEEVNVVSEQVKETVKSDLAALKTDFKDAKINTRIEGVKFVDGKVTAQFYVSGLSAKKNKYSDSYRDWPKIFDTWGDFATYAQKFFENEEFMLGEAKNNHNM